MSLAQVCTSTVVAATRAAIAILMCFVNVERWEAGMNAIFEKNVLDLAVGGGDPFPFEKKCQLVSKV